MKSEKLSAFGERLLEAFGEDVPKSKIAEVMGVKQSAVTNYLQERIPDAEKLQLVSNFTNCSIHWLITGEGEKLLNSAKETNLDDTFREIMREMIREEIVKNQNNEAKVLPTDFKIEKERKSVSAPKK